MTLAEIFNAVSALPATNRRDLLKLLKAEFPHSLEHAWGVSAEVILESIARSSDFTQRGIRGVIAESVFVTDVLPRALKGTAWQIVEDHVSGNIPFDALVRHGASGKSVRIQVKNQRRETNRTTGRMEPKEKKGCWVVEVQKTRSGEKYGEKTRPYRFADFDLLAVCMYPSSGDWTKFAYCASQMLEARPDANTLVEIFQLIPKKLPSSAWSASLVETLELCRTSRGRGIAWPLG